MSSAAGRRLPPLLGLAVALALVAVGLERGVWWTNLHNGLLATVLAAVGAYVLLQRPGHREGVLFLAAGLVQAVMFLGRQRGHDPVADVDRWLGWLGVWPLAVSIGLVSLVAVLYPDGRLPAPGWRWVVRVGAVLVALCALTSALWPVEYGATGVVTPFPLALPQPAFVQPAWDAVAHPSYAVMQLLPLLALAHRWHLSGAVVRRQIAWVLGAAVVSALAVVMGLVVWQTPRPGIWSAALLPVAAGWAIVHGQRTATRRALTWSAPAPEPGDAADPPVALARAAAESLAATTGKLWMGTADRLQAVAVWPVDAAYGEPTSWDLLAASPDHQVRSVTSAGEVVGALGVERSAADRLSIHEVTILDALTGQAGLVVANLDLARLVTRERGAGHLDRLTPRERDVLELMARGLSNQAICAELHLSIKTVEPLVSSVFARLDLHADSATNRRVLAVLAFVREA
ncbi:LuxR family transcriptional regulator [uncultured Nocardioides sp.]|uniref:response regulator transcription factor n=1 Tax=uncultured Nocardioides sp. TaxID=198441 RepID=UPI00260BD83C|nr:LuxR family transcriptional regulator [uncultured Nocardioides sp.]